MKQLLELSDSSLGLPAPAKPTYGEEREAARAVLFDGENVALLFVGKHGYHKLPGGGIEEGESIEQALGRELLEETGCKARVVAELGYTVEYRAQLNLKQLSYCFIAEKVSQGAASLDESEVADAFALEWVPLRNAIELLESERPSQYEGKFIVPRELAFLRAAENVGKQTV